MPLEPLPKETSFGQDSRYSCLAALADSGVATQNPRPLKQHETWMLKVLPMHLWWAEGLFDFHIDVRLTILHENGTVGVTLAHLLLALKAGSSSSSKGGSSGSKVIISPPTEPAAGRHTLSSSPSINHTVAEKNSPELAQSLPRFPNLPGVTSAVFQPTHPKGYISA